MHILVILTSLILTLTLASPITTRAGAGGPIAKPIPQTCTITNPLPNNDCSTSLPSGHKPNPAFTSAHTLYQSYFDLPTPVQELWTHCSQQCYGYGEEGDCKSAMLAYEVPVPEGYYGAEEGGIGIACLLFDHHLTPEDFVGAAEGQWVDERAGSIYC